MSEILTRLRGYNPPDRTHDSERIIAKDISAAADEIERLRLALAEAHARIADLENPDFVNCDGLHADGKYPNTPHRPIGINRLYPCPACTAERERDEARKRWAFWEESAAMLRLVNEDYIRKNVALVNDLTAEIRRAEALRATAPHVNPGDGAVREAAEETDRALRDWLTSHSAGHAGALVTTVRTLLSALSSPPRPETKDDALHATPESERACVVCDADVCEHVAARLAPPADAATEAVRMLRHLCNVYGCTSYGRKPDHGPDDCSWCEAEALLSAPAPAPSAKETR